MSKVYKYQKDIDEASKVSTCPKSKYFEFEDKTAYRFVFKDLNHPNNFIPPAKINPKRFLESSEVKKCGLLGVSLFGKKKGAIERYEELLVTFNNFKKVIGTHIAEGTISKNDGHITKESRTSHFDLYEFKDADLVPKFNVVEEL